MLFGPPVPFEGQLKQQPSFFLISKGTKYSQYLNNSLLAYCSIFLFILLIVSCLLGSQTCWWPLNSLCVFVLWSACVCAHARVCVITSVSAAACAPFVFCHVIIFSPVLLIDYLSSGWKVEFCFTKLANSEFSLPPTRLSVLFLKYRRPLLC